MNLEPRYESDYTRRQVDAAHRVLIDLGQVLASFKDCMVVVGGWIPDLLITGWMSRTAAALMWISLWTPQN